MTIEPLAIPLPGGCLCGRVRYRILEDPIAYYICHCTDCQRESGVAFGLTMLFRRTALTHDRGETRSVAVQLPDASRVRNATVCSECLLRIWAESSQTPQILGLNPGTLDDPRAYEPFGNMWTTSAHRWVSLAPGPRFERQPEDPIAMVRGWQEHLREKRSRA